MISEFLSRGATSEIQTTDQTIGVGQQFLRFHLMPDTTALLPVQQMTEVLTLAINEVVPIPHMPAWVMGVYNWRGEILWLVDLGQLIGLAPIYQQATSRSTYTAIIVHTAKQAAGKQLAGSQNTGMLGLLVNRVEDMESCNPDLIQSPPMAAVSPELVPFLRGYWLKPNGEILVVLDSDSIIARMPRSQDSV